MLEMKPVTKELCSLLSAIYCLRGLNENPSDILRRLLMMNTVMNESGSRKDAANQSPCQNKNKIAGFSSSVFKGRAFVYDDTDIFTEASPSLKVFVIRVLEGPLGATIAALSLLDQILAEMSLVSCDFGWRVSLLRVLPHNTALLSGQKPAEMTPRCLF